MRSFRCYHQNSQNRCTLEIIQKETAKNLIFSLKNILTDRKKMQSEIGLTLTDLNEIFPMKPMKEIEFRISRKL